MKFQDTLQKIRKDRKLSQEDLAQQLGLSRQAVAKWEAGVAFPDIDNLIRMSEIFSTTIDSLVKDNAQCSNKCLVSQSMNNNEMIEFLLDANKKTYAGKGKEEVNSSRPNSHDLKYEQGNMKYIDTYVGGERFSGEEAVFKNDSAVWAMNYSGRTLEELFSGDFLKEVLMLRTIEDPFRGPRLYKNGNYVYHNTVDGDFNWFQGKEEIFCGDLKVYECFFHGGIVR